MTRRAAREARAEVDASLGARVVSRTPLLYTHGPDLSLDRPAHVRAGSALTRLGCGRLAVVQDDASFLGLVDPETQACTGLPLPADGGVRLFDDTRGNKKRKLDLEACILTADGAMLAFGSGSTSTRERIAA